jgi:dCMP deaminase
MSINEWDKWFYESAQRAATLSIDPHKKVGCVLANVEKVPSSYFYYGYNRLPDRLSHLSAQLSNQEWKRENIIHAEIDALLHAHDNLEGYTVYCTNYPCLYCAKSLIHSGIIRLVCPEPNISHPYWGISYMSAQSSLTEAGIRIDLLRGN